MFLYMQFFYKWFYFLKYILYTPDTGCICTGFSYEFSRIFVVFAESDQSSLVGSTHKLCFRLLFLRNTVQI
jgi:hypothetical protein